MDSSTSMQVDESNKRRPRELSESSNELAETTEEPNGAAALVVKPKHPSSKKFKINAFEGFQATSQNQEMNNVIIIEPKEEQKKDFFSNNLKTFRLLEKSAIGKAGIVENKRNLKRGTQIVKISNTENLLQILEIKQLGEYEVECSLPKGKLNTNREIYKIGVIGSIGKDTDLNEIKEILESSYPDQIYKVDRLMSRKNKIPVPTNLIKIWFRESISELPEYVILFAERFRVSKFIDRSLQCYQCQDFGHFASQCVRNPKCVLCAGDHKLSDCPNKKTLNIEKDGNL